MTDVILRGGVDRKTPRALAKPGTLYDCQNYEVGLEFGYARIDGHEVFDGRMSPSTRDIWEATLANSAITPAYSSRAGDVSGEDVLPAGITFSADGSKMYMVGATASASVYQYNLSTAWDASKAFYTTKTKDISAQTAAPTAIALNDDGTKMYVAAGSSVYQYTLSTPWDVSTASYATKVSDTSSEETGIQGIAFSSDGTALFVVGTSADTVFQYTLSTAWDASTAAYASKSQAIPAGETAVTGLSFTDSGQRFYVIGTTLGDVHQYTCSTAWDVSTATEDSITFDVTGEDAAPVDVYFKPDGSRFYVLGNTNDSVYEYYWTAVANENLSWVNGTDTGDLGVVISTTIGASNTVIRFAYWNSTDALPSGATVTGDDSGVSFSATPTFVALQDVATDAGDYFDQLFNASEVLRAAITPVPGSGVVSGIKWYKDQQYAVRDYYKFNYDNGDIAEPEPGQHVIIGDGGATSTVFGDEGIVREINVDSGTFAGSDGAGTIVIEPLTNAFDFGNALGAGAAENFLIPLVEVHFSSGSTEPTYGQQLTGATSTEDVYVWRVELQSGAWADGDATGIVYVYSTTGALQDAETLNRASPAATNIMTVDGVPLYSAEGQVLQYVSADNDGHSQAGMYRSTRSGWEKIEMGWEMSFNTGTNEPVATTFGADTDTQTIIATDWATAGTQRDLGGYDPSAGSELDAVTGSGGAYAYVTEKSTSYYYHWSKYYFALHNFGITLPEGARVVGVEVEITAKNAAGETSWPYKVELYMNDAGEPEGGYIDGAEDKTGDGLTTSFVANTLGGAEDSWLIALTAAMVTDSDFGVKFKYKWDSDGAAADLQTDLVRMRVHYVEQGSTIYFYDTVNLADYTSAQLIHFNAASGTWAGNDAAGTLQAYSLYKNEIPTADIEIRDTPAGGGNLIGNFTGTQTSLSLPGSTLVSAVNAKYQMIAENAFARDDLEAIYGVTGVGRAFSYDNYFLRFLNSGLADSLDKPRHVELFQFRLWLGYGFGEMAISVAGNPLSFDGTLNAVATGFGRPLTGLSKLPGKTMAVFTDQTVFTVTVAGADFDQQVISPRHGAREYTVQSVGDYPVYSDTRGLAAPMSTDKFGDFEAVRQSLPIQSWLLKRIQNIRHNSTRNDIPVASTVNRLKGQYRMYFADGVRLTMTTFGDDVPPEFTMQKLYTGGDPDQYIRVLATDADVDNNSQDRTFFTMDVNPDYDHGADLGYVYEDDRGTSFNGANIKHWLEMQPLSVGDITTNTVWGPWHLYGLAHGWADLSLTTAENFGHPVDSDSSTEDANYDIALGATGNDVQTEPETYQDKNRLQRRGTHLVLRVQGESDRELPHVLQHINLVDEKKARVER